MGVPHFSKWRACFTHKSGVLQVQSPISCLHGCVLHRAEFSATSRMLWPEARLACPSELVNVAFLLFLFWEEGHTYWC